MKYNPLTKDEMSYLADLHQPDNPLNVQTRYFLKNGLAKVYLKGSIEVPQGYIIQSESAPSEPIGFGRDAEILFDILQSVEGWDCILVETEEIANELAEILRSQGKKIRFYHDIVLTSKTITNDIKVPANVRLLNLDKDEDLLKTVPPYFHINRKGIVAVAIEDNRIVSFSHTYSITEGYVDIGTHTDESEIANDNGEKVKKYWGKGYSTSTAYLVAKEVIRLGKQPVWSCGEANIRSLRVAEKLGLKVIPEYTRPYVIVEK